MMIMRHDDEVDDYETYNDGETDENTIKYSN